ncbi:hypothetical protein GCM10011392_36800 [Wenxinia marina]|nr:hypothetical protein GCM10011392_36800 [Wenxinia marina]
MTLPILRPVRSGRKGRNTNGVGGEDPAHQKEEDGRAPKGSARQRGEWAESRRPCPVSYQ